MNSERATLLLVRGALSELPQEQQDAVNAAHEKLKAIVTEAGDVGLLALALLGAEIQAED